MPNLGLVYNLFQWMVLSPSAFYELSANNLLN